MVMNSTYTQLEKDLSAKGWCLSMTEGDSMEPLLRQNQNMVLIERAQGILNINDVALYRRLGQNKLVLHRVVKVRARDYLICGDNRLYKEVVPHGWVIGVMRGYYENNNFISTDDTTYKDYVRNLKKRYVIRYLREFPGRIKRKAVRMLDAKKKL